MQSVKRHIDDFRLGCYAWLFPCSGVFTVKQINRWLAAKHRAGFRRRSHLLKNDIVWFTGRRRQVYRSASWVSQLLRVWFVLFSLSQPWVSSTYTFYFYKVNKFFVHTRRHSCTLYVSHLVSCCGLARPPLARGKFQCANSPFSVDGLRLMLI